MTASTKNIASFSCKFSQPNGAYEISDVVKGTITVTPKLDLQYKHIYYKVYWEIEPVKVAVEKKEVVSMHQHLAKAYGYWKEGESYEYHFDFTPTVPFSLKGIYFEIHWYVEIEVELTRTAREKLRRQAASRLHWQGMLFPKNMLSFRFPFTLERGNNPYQVGASYTHEDFASRLVPYYIGAGVGLLGIVFGWQAWLNFTLPVFEIVGSGALGVGSYQMFVGFGKLQQIHFNVRPFTNRHFELEIDVQKNWRSVEAFRVDYTVNQELDVVDNNNHHNVHTSEVYRYKSPQEYSVKGSKTKIHISLPQNKNLPTSMNQDPYVIFWELEIVVVLTSGREQLFKHIFFVNV